jgi:putative glutathione S-transferase
MDIGGKGMSAVQLPILDFFLILLIGWRFATHEENLPGANTIPDPISSAEFIKDLYLLANPNYSGRFSVPVLWDKKTKTIVNNESSEIIRMFATEFNDLLDEEHKSIDIIPENLINTIDELNEWIYVSFRVCNIYYNQGAHIYTG